MATSTGGGLSRREASKRILKLLALATGLSVPEVRALLAAGAGAQAVQTPTPWFGGKPTAKATPWFAGQTGGANRNTIVAQKSAANDVKILKVLLENNRQVFENQFGRSTAIIQRPINPGKIANVCGVNFGGADVINEIGGGALGLFCQDVNTCTGQDLGGDGCNGMNSCSGQTCDQNNCNDNLCQGQKCQLDNCGNNSQKIVSAEMLTQFRTDAYIQLLFQEFNVTSPDQLAQSINARLAALVQQVRH
jgi:hypothetical protein